MDSDVARRQRQAQRAPASFVAIGRDDLKAAADFAATLPPSCDRDNSVSNIASQWGQSDLTSAKGAAHHSTPRQTKRDAKSRAAMGAGDPPGASNYAQSLPAGKDQNGFLSSMASKPRHRSSGVMEIVIASSSTAAGAMPSSRASLRALRKNSPSDALDFVYKLVRRSSQNSVRAACRFIVGRYRSACCQRGPPR